MEVQLGGATGSYQGNEEAWQDLGLDEDGFQRAVTILMPLKVFFRSLATSCSDWVWLPSPIVHSVPSCEHENAVLPTRAPLCYRSWLCLGDKHRPRAKTSLCVTTRTSLCVLQRTRELRWVQVRDAGAHIMESLAEVCVPSTPVPTALSARCKLHHLRATPLCCRAERAGDERQGVHGARQHFHARMRANIPGFILAPPLRGACRLACRYCVRP